MGGKVYIHNLVEEITESIKTNVDRYANSDSI